MKKLGIALFVLGTVALSSSANAEVLFDGTYFRIEASTPVRVGTTEDLWAVDLTMTAVHPTIQNACVFVGGVTSVNSMHNLHLDNSEWMPEDNSFTVASGGPLPIDPADTHFITDFWRDPQNPLKSYIISVFPPAESGSAYGASSEPVPAAYGDSSYVYSDSLTGVIALANYMEKTWTFMHVVGKAGTEFTFDEGTEVAGLGGEEYTGSPSALLDAFPGLAGDAGMIYEGVAGATFTVPEPATLTALALTGLAALSRRRRNHR